MAKKVSTTGKSHKSLIILIVLVAIVAGAAGFYYGRTLLTKSKGDFAHTKSTADWVSYKSSEGWELKHPKNMGINRNSESITLNQKTATDTFFEEKNVEGTVVEVGIVKNPEKTPLYQWVESWVEDYNATCRNHELTCVGRMNKTAVTIGGHEALSVYINESGDYQKDLSYFFVPLDDQSFFWSRAQSSNQLEVSKYTLEVQKGILASFHMPGATYPHIVIPTQ